MLEISYQLSITACGDQRIGSECELVCGSAVTDDSSCSDNKFCLSGPNECSCIAGYAGASCNESKVAQYCFKSNPV